MMTNTSDPTDEPVDTPPASEPPAELSDDDCHGDFGEGGDGESIYEELTA